MKEDLLLYEAGYRGEGHLDYHLSFLKSEDVEKVQDLRLRAGSGYYFQMDTLLVTPHFLVILEVKNLSGRVEFMDDTKQMVRRLNGEEVIMPNPLLQVRRQQNQLADWMLERGYPLIPIEQLVVFANPSTFVQSTEAGKQSLSKIVYAEGVVDRIEKLRAFYSKNKSRSYLDPLTRAKLVEQLRAHHSPPLIDILRTYNLTTTHLRNGVFCPNCNTSLMIRQGQSGKWHCTKCKKTSKHAHMRALEDYYLLWKTTITNAEMRAFLGVESKMAVNRMLSKLDIKRTYSNRHCYYHLTYPLRLK